MAGTRREPPTAATAGSAPTPGPARTGVPFGVNEVRLNGRQWLAVGLILFLTAQLLPRVWERLERFDQGSDYRIPYSLSKDYWIYSRRVRQVSEPKSVLVLGDSVVWGEYVLPDGTLTHFLNDKTGAPNRFINAGVNGLFPLALEGLVRYYGKPIRQRKVILHCNVLWMTSPKADLSTDKEEKFNHAGLVPQFVPRIPCYKADASTRLTAVVERNSRFLAWVNHLQNAYFDQRSILGWTLTDDGGDPPHYPNSWKNPLAQIRWSVPVAPAIDPQRGPQSPRHRAWSAGGARPTRFDWVALDRSLQWQAFQRLVRLLQERNNNVLVVLGPFNESMLSDDNQGAYLKIRDGIDQWLTELQVPHVLPESLPSALYADASHPLTEGYQMLAQRLQSDPKFSKWLQQR